MTVPAFRLVGLPADPFLSLFELDDAALAARDIRRVVADEDFGFPCRVSLADAAAGDELLLLPHEHLPARSPYRASGPIFVRRGARQAVLPAGELPPYVTRRLMSVRVYDGADMMVEAEVCPGEALRPVIERLLADPDVSCLHLHNAKRGCYSCRVERVDAAAPERQSAG